MLVFWRKAPQPDVVSLPSMLAMTALKIAMSERGKGEEGANNRGPEVRKYGRGVEGGAWCAAFVSWALEEAAKEIGMTCPIKRSHGAKQLWKRCRDYGEEIDWRNARRLYPGDIVCFSRGREGSWQGHIGIVSHPTNGLVTVCHGNTGSFPAKVRTLVHDFHHEKIVGVARI